jgi:hypothetical protein
MLPHTANGDSRLSFWLRVREFAVPPSMIETATARRRAGDWAGACAAAGVDVDLDLRSVARTHGRELAARVRADLRRLAPDLLRWHLPRIAPDGLLRPGLTLTLARYARTMATTMPRARRIWWSGLHPPGRTAASGSASRCGTAPAATPTPVGIRTPGPADGSASTCTDICGTRAGAVSCGTRSGAIGRPPPPDLRRTRMCGRRCRRDATAPSTGGPPRRRSCSAPRGARPPVPSPCGSVPGTGCSWTWTRSRTPADRTGSPTDGTTTGPPPRCRSCPTRRPGPCPTWNCSAPVRSRPTSCIRWSPPHSYRIAPDRTRPVPRRIPDRTGQPHLVECRGAQHRIGLVDGVLAPLDHDPAEIRREELLVALTGTPLPCLQAIDEAHRHPDCLTGVRERLIHGDTAGALAVVEGLLGPDAVLRDGALRDELEAAERRLIVRAVQGGPAEPGPRSGHFCPGLSAPGKPPLPPPPPAADRTGLRPAAPPR